MRLYQRTTEYNCGVDLHTRQMYVCVVDREGSDLMRWQTCGLIAEGLPAIEVQPRPRDRWEKELQQRHTNEFLKMTVETDLALIREYDRQIDRLERTIMSAARKQRWRDLHVLLSIPGVGKVLAMTLLYEIGYIGRFDTHQQFASYCREPLKTERIRKMIRNLLQRSFFLLPQRGLMSVGSPWSGRLELHGREFVSGCPGGHTKKLHAHYTIILVEVEHDTRAYLFGFNNPFLIQSEIEGVAVLVQLDSHYVLLNLRSKKAVTRFSGISLTFTMTRSHRFPNSGICLMKCLVPSD